jgi:hypothetical protein
MSHRAVETVIGRLVTDECFRRRFYADPPGALAEVQRWGGELTALEREALRTIDAAAIAALAEVVDARLQKLDVESP